LSTYVTSLFSPALLYAYQSFAPSAVPFETGTKTLLYAPDDSKSLYPAPVSTFTQRSQALAQRYFDFRFLGEPKQIHDPAVAKEFQEQFLWDEWMEPDEQNQYKYMLDIDGNGWSGRFHRCVHNADHLADTAKRELTVPPLFFPFPLAG
jgi:hypothetical protein